METIWKGCGKDDMVEYDEYAYLPQYMSLYWVTSRLHCEFLSKVHKTKCVPLFSECIQKITERNTSDTDSHRVGSGNLKVLAILSTFSYFFFN